MCDSYVGSTAVETPVGETNVVVIFGFYLRSITIVGSSDQITIAKARLSLPARPSQLMLAYYAPQLWSIRATGAAPPGTS